MVSLVLQQVCQNSASPMDTCCLLIMKTWLIVLWLSFWIAQPSGNRRHHSALIFFLPPVPEVLILKTIGKKTDEVILWFMWSILFILKHMCRNFRAVQVKTLYQKKKKKLISLKKIVLRTFLVKWKVFKKKKNPNF